MKKVEWGFHDGYAVFLVTIEKNGLSANLTNFGATLVNLYVKDRHTNPIDVVLGYDDLGGYERGGASHGATIGRYANRIKGASFVLNGKTYTLPKNDGNNCLHGGFYGYKFRVWEIKELTNDSVTFGYHSPDGECGFPSAVDISVRFSITDDNALQIDYSAISDGDTVLNLTNHAYFNLGGYDSGDILDTELQIFADRYNPVDNELIPTGELAAVSGTPFDFTSPKTIGQDIHDGKISGYDHNFVINSDGSLTKAVVAYSSKTGIEMQTLTCMPGVQLYTSNTLMEDGKNGTRVGNYGGFCLETQLFPDTPNRPDFPSCVLKGGEKWASTTIYKFRVR